jgi:hypothetical protein
MTLHPKHMIDLLLAPVAAEIDDNLKWLRDKPPIEIEKRIELACDTGLSRTPAERAEHVLEAACQNVDLHGWQVQITEDNCRLRLDGGSVAIELGLGSAVMQYIDSGDGEGAAPAQGT